MSSSITDDITSCLIAQINKYAEMQGFPNLKVLQQNVIAKMPNYPYVAINCSDSYIQNQYDPIASNFDMKFDIKAIANDKRVYNRLFEYLRRLFFLQQPTYDLAQQGIGVTGVDVLPLMPDYVENATIFDGGIELSVNVNRENDDYTQTGEMDNVSSEFEGGK